MAHHAALTSPLPARDFLLKQSQGELPALPSSDGAPPPEDGEQLGLLALIAAANGFREVALAAVHGLKALRSPSLRARVYTDVADAQLTQVRRRRRDARGGRGSAL